MRYSKVVTVLYVKGFSSLLEMLLGDFALCSLDIALLPLDFDDDAFLYIPATEECSGQDVLCKIAKEVWNTPYFPERNHIQQRLNQHLADKDDRNDTNDA